ncbi:conserved hypothetical protein [Trichinella spiralis]|uniref:hypothetical protein n=1 Tax=Trichinella spiralis TaxID=6334 RepID=UPI0001EFEFB9|nr:conserved hypothetical protein [Trichinella spiralis]
MQINITRKGTPFSLSICTWWCTCVGWHRQIGRSMHLLSWIDHDHHCRRLYYKVGGGIRFIFRRLFILFPRIGKRDTSMINDTVEAYQRQRHHVLFPRRCGQVEFVNIRYGADEHFGIVKYRFSFDFGKPHLQSRREMASTERQLRHAVERQISHRGTGEPGHNRGIGTWDPWAS